MKSDRESPIGHQTLEFGKVEEKGNLCFLQRVSDERSPTVLQATNSREFVYPTVEFFDRKSPRKRFRWDCKGLATAWQEQEDK
jgi:hypothetical protein